MVVLDFYRMCGPAKRAFFTFAVFKADFTDMPAAAGYFDADDFTVDIEINPVVIDFTLVQAVHGCTTPFMLLLTQI